MKSLDPQRLRIVLCCFLAALSVAAMFVATHRKAHIGVASLCALGAVLFLFVGLRTAYNLTSNSN
jgi:hypothetical protein